MTTITDTPTSHEEIKARIEEQAQVYVNARDRIAALTLVDILVSVRAEYPAARWVGLGTGDQDMSGYQVPTVITDDLGRILADDASECLDDVPVSNLDDACEVVWGLLTVAADELGLAESDHLAERWLDLDKVAAADLA